MYFKRGSKRSRRPVREKRGAARFSFESPDEFIVEFKSGKQKEHRLGFGRDIATAGIRFASPVALRPREKMEIVLHFTKRFPGTKTLRLKAEVIRGYRLAGTPYYRIGCRLIHPDEKTKDTIREFLDWVKRTTDFAFLEDTNPSA